MHLLLGLLLGMIVGGVGKWLYRRRFVSPPPTFRHTPAYYAVIGWALQGAWYGAWAMMEQRTALDAQVLEVQALRGWTTAEARRSVMIGATADVMREQVFEQWEKEGEER